MKHIKKTLILTVKSVMNQSLQCSEVEIMKVIQQLHKSCREIYKKKEQGKIEDLNKRHHIAARRDQVSQFLFIYSNIKK
jgi:hypothetical protein